MYGTVSGTDNGYSSFEFEVYYVSNLITNLARGKLHPHLRMKVAMYLDMLQ